MARFRLYLRQTYEYTQEWYYETSDEEFLEQIQEFYEDNKQDYGEEFTPENILAVLKGESDILNLQELVFALIDFDGEEGFFGEYDEGYSDHPTEFVVETDSEFVEELFKRAGKLK